MFRGLSRNGPRNQELLQLLEIRAWPFQRVFGHYCVKIIEFEPYHQEAANCFVN